MISRAITLWPEWGFAIAHLGKRTENRTWSPPPSMFGQQIAIHAGAYIGGRKAKVARAEGLQALSYAARQSDILLEFDEFDPAAVQVSWPPVLNPCIRGGLPRTRNVSQFRIATRAIVAIATLVDAVNDKTCGPADIDPWYVGPVGWRLTDVLTFSEPIADVVGAQGLWPLSADALGRIPAYIHAIHATRR